VIESKWTEYDNEVFDIQAEIWDTICKTMTVQVSQFHARLESLCTRHGANSLYHKWNESESLTFYEELVILASEAITD